MESELNQLEPHWYKPWNTYITLYEMYVLRIVLVRNQWLCVCAVGCLFIVVSQTRSTLLDSCVVSSHVVIKIERCYGGREKWNRECCQVEISRPNKCHIEPFYWHRPTDHFYILVLKMTPIQRFYLTTVLSCFCEGMISIDRNTIFW